MPKDRFRDSKRRWMRHPLGGADRLPQGQKRTAMIHYVVNKRLFQNGDGFNGKLTTNFAFAPQISS
jgi:hypothetical protein